MFNVENVCKRVVAIILVFIFALANCFTILSQVTYANAGELGKQSGYQSYHMIVNVPVVIIDKIVYVKVEIQIRSLAMDFWASLEHKLKYKGSVSQKDSLQLVKCANVISKVDDKMQLIKER